MAGFFSIFNKIDFFLLCTGEKLQIICNKNNVYTSVMQNIVSVHCREEGCIGKYIPRGPRDFPRAGILHPEARVNLTYQARDKVT